MTGLICGVVDLGGCTDPEGRVRHMVSALCADIATSYDVAVTGPVALAQCEVAPVQPVEPSVRRHRRNLLCGNFDLLYPLGSRESEPRESSGLQRSIVQSEAVTPAALDGEYAFAHWNGSEHRLSLVRDRGATRPLFFVHRKRKWLAFASLPRALLSAGFATGQHDSEILALWSLTYSNHGSRTHFRDIERVLPAHVLQADPNGVRQTPYWSPLVSEPIPLEADYDEVTSELRDRIQCAVRRRLPTSGRAFAHLSGGLDSTGIAALAAKALAPSARGLTAYTFTPQSID